MTLRGYVYPVTGGFTPPEMPGYTPGVGLPFDPERARQLLAQAGYAEGRNFPVVEALNGPFSEPFAKFLQAAWREHLGVEIPWQTVPLTIYHERMVSAPPDLSTGLWVADYPDPDCYLRVCVEMDIPRWGNANYWQLVEEARRVTDHAERMRLYGHAERLLAEDVPLIPLTYGRVHLLLKPWIKGYQLSTMKGQFWKDVVIEAH
jgi:ABC-type transport system substrate-binding protein